jgi:hypothetical protein
MVALPPAKTTCRIRQATNRDFNGLLDFYEQNRSTVLPLESAKTVGDAIEQGRILVVERLGDSGIVATGAVFQLTPLSSSTYVAETAGMRVTKALGGMGPINVQMMLIGLRLLGHAATDLTPNAKDATNSIIAAVAKNNERSIENIEAMHMKPLTPPLPNWLRYNQIGWNATGATEDWKYYYADNESVLHALGLLGPIGLFEEVIILGRTNRDTQQREVFEFNLELNDLRNAAEDFRQILNGDEVVALVPPPADLVFP